MSTPKRIKYKGQIYEAVINEGKAYKPVDNDEIYRAVNGILLKAFVQAEDIFEKYDEGELNDIISDGYPFDKSFAEMVWEVLDWRDNVREKTGHIAESVKTDEQLNKWDEIRGHIYNLRYCLSKLRPEYEHSDSKFAEFGKHINHLIELQDFIDTLNP